MPTAKAARIYREMRKGIHEAENEISHEHPGRTAEEMNAEMERLMRKAARTSKKEHRKTLKHAARRELDDLKRKAAAILKKEARREELYQMLLHAANEIDDDALMTLMERLSVRPREVQTEEIENMLAGLQM
jgi:Sec-independent protein translocase protein TatA